MMNTRILYFLLLTVCCGCRVNKEKSERLHVDSQSQSRLEASASWVQVNSQDSSYRYWYFSGDSSFFFHPDQGLWSRSGQIVYGEQRALKQQVAAVEHSYDSLGSESDQVQQQTHTKKTTYPLYSWLWALAIIPIVVVFYWRRR